VLLGVPKVVNENSNVLNFLDIPDANPCKVSVSEMHGGKFPLGSHWNTFFRLKTVHYSTHGVSLYGDIWLFS
jgi:hypothetical protein